jgi:hypothetical protein
MRSDRQRNEYEESRNTFPDPKCREPMDDNPRGQRGTGDRQRFSKSTHVK